MKGIVIVSKKHFITKMPTMEHHTSLLNKHNVARKGNFTCNVPTRIAIVMPWMHWFTHIHDMFTFWDVRALKQKNMI